MKLKSVEEKLKSFEYTESDIKLIMEVITQNNQAILAQLEEVVERQNAFLVPKSKFHSVGAGLAIRKDDLLADIRLMFK